MNRISLIAAALALATRTWGGPFDDTLVQTPSLGQPQRGSVAGSSSRTAFGPADLARGSFRLGLPIDVPEERGPLLAGLVPTYSMEAGLNEWGMGWSLDLAIRRHRDAGDLDYATDGFITPWGRLELGSDGAYYPRGLAAVVKVTRDDLGWEAKTPEGTIYRFRKTVTTPRGTYAWMLSEVQTVLGDKTTLTWVSNATGRAFLTKARWGGRGDGNEYEAVLTYETLPVPRESYASGARLDLDRRVKNVIVRARSGGAYVERWRFLLGYTTSPFGPAFYLTSIQKRYKSGEVEPEVRYEFDMGVERLAAAPLVTVAGLEPLLVERGAQVLNPDRSATTDLEDNGLVDLEDAYDETTWRQTGEGTFASETLPAPTGQEHPRCRAPGPSSFNAPRRLVRMHPGAAEPQVLATEYSFGIDMTNVVVCDRAGRALFNAPVAGNWDLGPSTRLTDVTSDHRPDLVRVGHDRVEVLVNASEGEGALAFGAIRTTLIVPQIDSPASWVLDANGDGKADLIKRTSEGFWVWPGKGGGEVQAQGRLLQVEENGEIILGVEGLHASFGDYNNDGLVDVILTQSRDARVYINRGDRLVYRPVPMLSGIPLEYDAPLVVDLTGSGDEEVTFTAQATALAVRLTSASTGLLRQADDGKGTKLTFEYRRAAPANGVGRRPAVHDRLTVATVGYDAVTTSYDYAQPVVHRVGRYLVGFGEIVRVAPLATETATFANDDEVSGVPLASEVIDERTPGLTKISRQSYEEAQFRGIRWLRPTESGAGWRASDGTELFTTHRVLEYQREICPTVTEDVLPGGTLRRELMLASVAGLDNELHCLPSLRRLVGTHADPALNFDYAATLARNASGQVTSVSRGPRVLQQVDYDGAGRAVRIGAPGRGISSIAWDPLGRLAGVVAPDGVDISVADRDPVTDARRALRTDRGDGAILLSSYRHDAQERLWKWWDDLSGTSEAIPGQTLGYLLPTAERPGRIHTDAAMAAGATRRVAELIAGDGEILTTAHRAGGVWILGAARRTERSTATVSTLRLDPVPDLAALVADDLTGPELSRTESAGFGHAARQTEVHQTGVVGEVATTLSLEGSELVLRETENGSFARVLARDAAGRVVRKTDELGVTHSYGYDALGRLVVAHTPSGDHRLSFDAFGQPRRIERDGVAAVEYGYDAVTGLPTQERLVASDGTVEREATQSYDAIGRLVTLEQRKGADTRRTTFTYDGVGQRGQLTRIDGDGFWRTAKYDRGGRLTEGTTGLLDWRTVTVSPRYGLDGTMAGETMTFRDAHGAVVSTRAKDFVYDADGRLQKLLVNGQALYTLAYDGLGRLARADFAGGEAIVFSHDDTTRAVNGYTLEAPVGSGGLSWRRDARGLVEREVVMRGTTQQVRAYVHDARGQLLGSDDAAYTYDAAGMPETASDVLCVRTFGRQGEVSIGGIVYRFDALGRVVNKGDLELGYGPSGDVETATRPGRSITYIYDEKGQRVLKLVNGTPTAGYIAGGVLTEAGFVEPVLAGGITVGVLENGAFRSLLTDPRGTPVVDDLGAAYPASPYGVRTAHHALAEAIDYANLGHDADLDAVRMGVRDYDPYLGQFRTPDPKFLEDLGAVAQSPLEANLFAYAAGNPISFIDPSGLEVVLLGTTEKKVNANRIVLQGLLGVHGNITTKTDSQGNTVFGYKQTPEQRERLARAGDKGIVARDLLRAFDNKHVFAIRDVTRGRAPAGSEEHELDTGFRAGQLLIRHGGALTFRPDPENKLLRDYYKGGPKLGALILIDYDTNEVPGVLDRSVPMPDQILLMHELLGHGLLDKGERDTRLYENKVRRVFNLAARKLQ